MNLCGKSWEPAGIGWHGAMASEREYLKEKVLVYMLQDSLTLQCMLAMLRSMMILTRLVWVEW